MKLDFALVEQYQQWLARGEILAYPTETVWGLGVDIRFPQAIEAIYELKGRAEAKSISLLVRDLKMAKSYAHFTRPMEIFCSLFWPGPVTLVLPVIAATVPESIHRGSGYVGLRRSSHPFVRALMRSQPYPITTTSANLSGTPPARHQGELAWLEGMAHRVEWPDPCIGSGSTVVKISATGEFHCLRHGDFPIEPLLLIAEQSGLKVNLPG